ncbi:MAG: hypothetical protein ACMZI0_05670 [Symbiopectobacterium sp.]|uniref:hypothetical protein n=1 Tax=Symbiopectobacterium sp. TaxID=2952789 RepID=UPI0039EBFB3F
MLPSTSSTSVTTHAVSSPQCSSQESTNTALRIELIKNKLSSIHPDYTCCEINCFKDFFDTNQAKILIVSKTNNSINELLKTTATTINAIKNNIELGEDNTKNYAHLNQLKDDIEKLIQSSNSNNTSLGERIGNEINRVFPRVENEVRRSADKIAKEAKRFFRKF